MCVAIAAITASVAATNEAKADFTLSFAGKPIDYALCEEQYGQTSGDTCLPTGPVSMSFTYSGSLPKKYTGTLVLSSQDFQYTLINATETGAGFTFNIPPVDGSAELVLKNGVVTSWVLGFSCGEGYTYACPSGYYYGNIAAETPDFGCGTFPVACALGWYSPDANSNVFAFTEAVGPWAITGDNSKPPVAVDEAAYSQAYTPVTIDLTNGSSGAPYSASLVGTPTGGTVTGFPGTTVTFMPTSGVAQGRFQFSLTNVAGTSNTATTIVTATLLSAQTKALFAALGEQLYYVSVTFQAASIVTEAATGGIKKALVDTLVYAANYALNSALAQDDQLVREGADFAVELAEFSLKCDEKLTKTNYLSIPLEIDSLVFGFASLGSDAIAKDPPDRHYKVITRPDKLQFRETGNKKLDKIERDYLQFAGYEAAVVHAAERWEGAELAKNIKWEALQAAAFKKYSQDTANMIAKIQSDNIALSNDLPPVSINSFKGGAKALAKLFNSDCGKSLPKGLGNILRNDYYLSQDEINRSVCDYANSFNAQDISTDFGYALQLNLP